MNILVTNRDIGLMTSVLRNENNPIISNMYTPATIRQLQDMPIESAIHSAKATERKNIVIMPNNNPAKHTTSIARSMVSFSANVSRVYSNFNISKSFNLSHIDLAAFSFSFING